jgi:hypothetical protein
MSANGKADLQISPLKGGNVPLSDTEALALSLHFSRKSHRESRTLARFTLDFNVCLDKEK